MQQKADRCASMRRQPPLIGHQDTKAELCLAWHAAPRSAQRAAPEAALDSDDDDPVMEREVDLDAVLERRRQDAICSGNMIDLAADVDDEQLQRCTS